MGKSTGNRNQLFDSLRNNRSMVSIDFSLRYGTDPIHQCDLFLYFLRGYDLSPFHCKKSLDLQRSR